MKKKKVLFVIHALGGGGAERVLINLMKTLNPDKYDITLLSVVDSGIYRAQIPGHVHYKTIFKMPFQKEGAKKFDAGAKPGSGSLLAGAGRVKTLVADVYTFFWRHAPIARLYKSFIQERYDVEIAFLEGPCTKLVASSANSNSKKIAWLHVDLDKEGKSHAFYKNTVEESRAYACFDRIVFVSNGVKSSFLRHFPAYENKSLVLHNPINVREIESLSRKSCAELNETRLHGTVFLSAGRLCAQKAFDRVVETAAYLKEAGIDATFFVLGEGPDRQKLEQMAIGRGVSDTVIFLGYRENPYPYFRCADAFLCTSVAEGFSTTATEAAILGLPVITTDCAGMDELGEVYDSVYVCRNDAIELKRLVLSCVRDGLLDKPGRLYDRNYFDLFDRTLRVEELLDEVMNEK